MVNYQIFYPLLSAATFAISSVIIRNLEPIGSPSLLNLYRAGIGAILFLLNMFILNLIGEFLDLSWTIIFFLILSVVFNVVIGDTLFFTTQNMIGVRIATPIVNTFPLVTVVFAIIFLDEDISIQFIFSSIIIISGIIVLSLDTKDSILTDKKLKESKNLLPYILLFFVIICYSLGVLFTTIGSKGLSPVVANSVRLPTGTIMLLTLTYTQNNRKKAKIAKKLNNEEIDSPNNINSGKYSKSTLIKILLTGILGTYLSSWFLVLSVQKLGAGRTAVLTSTGPLFALPLAIFWLKEPMGIKTVIGTILTLIGLWIIL